MADSRDHVTETISIFSRVYGTNKQTNHQHYLALLKMNCELYLSFCVIFVDFTVKTPVSKSMENFQPMFFSHMIRFMIFFALFFINSFFSSDCFLYSRETNFELWLCFPSRLKLQTEQNVLPCVSGLLESLIFKEDNFTLKLVQFYCDGNTQGNDIFCSSQSVTC